MGLRVEMLMTWGDLSVVILPLETALRTTERTKTDTDNPRIPPAPSRVRWRHGFVNIVSAWIHRPKLPAYELFPDFRHRGNVCRMVRRFGVAAAAEPAVR